MDTEFYDLLSLVNNIEKSNPSVKENKSFQKIKQRGIRERRELRKKFIEDTLQIFYNDTNHFIKPDEASVFEDWLLDQLWINHMDNNNAQVTESFDINEKILT